MTFNSNTKDVLIWKDNMRFKLIDGSLSGCVTEISVHSDLDRKVMVSRYYISMCGVYTIKGVYIVGHLRAYPLLTRIF